MYNVAQLVQLDEREMTCVTEDVLWARKYHFLRPYMYPMLSPGILSKGEIVRLMENCHDLCWFPRLSIKCSARGA